MNRKVYLDAAATTPLDPRVVTAMKDALDATHGNPSSLHSFGRAARRAVEDARERVAAALHVHPREIVFTASATEANNAAVSGLAMRAPADRRRIVASPIEHPSVLAPLKRLESRGFTISWMPVTPDGAIDVAGSRALLDHDVAFCALMAVNNETGVIQPVEELAIACSEAGVPLHSDTVQGLGRIAAEPHRGVSTAAYSAHKVHGPTGAGLLVVRDGAAPVPLLVGGAQERDRRAGTENVPAIVGLARAVELATLERDERTRRVSRLDALLTAGLRGLPIERNATLDRVPAISSLRFERPHGETLLMNFDLRGVAVSMGSACSSGAVEPSHVLRAMGLSSAQCYASLRVSLSHVNEERDIEDFLKVAADVIDAAT